MNIQELENFQLAKAIDFNTDLNPQLFTTGDRMRPLVRNKLMNIADHFREFLGVQDIALIDIEVSGSNAAYSYTPHSDVDLHLIVDFSELPDNEIYKELFTAKQYQYNDQHDIKIKGYDVELYVQDAAQAHHSLGSYSVMNDEWNRIPTKQRANLNDTATLLKYEKLKALAIRALAADNEKYLIDVLDIVKKYRQAGLDQHGEFGPENLAFKMLRTDGYFEKLWKKKRGHVDQSLSLETEKPDTLAQELMAELNAGSTTIQTESMVKRMATARESLFDDFDYDYVYEAASGLVTLEAAYDGNIGLMELMKFYKTASKDMVDLLKRLIAANKNKEAWQLIQKVTDTNLVGKEFNEGKDNSIKISTPLKRKWTYYKVTADISKQIGVYLEDGEVIGLATINNQQILWMPFNDSMMVVLNKTPSGIKPINIVNDDIKAGYLYIRWDKAPKGRRADIAEQFAALNISKQFLKIPRTLYRGLVLTPQQIKNINAGKRLRASTQSASSWTTNRENAKTFTGAKQGVIIKKQFKISDVICHLELLDQFFGLPLQDRWMAENEVLVKGNGIGNYLDPNLEKIEFVNFYTEQVDEGVGIIIKGVNTTDDVDENSTKREAAKLRLTVTKDGIPPIPKNGVPDLFEGVLRELNMSPGRLQKEVNRIIKSAAPRIGLEFEVIMPHDEEGNPDITSHTTMDEIKEFFSENSDEDFAQLDEIYNDWLTEKQNTWTEEQANEVLNSPTEETSKKIEFMVDHYVSSGDADDIIAKITGSEDNIEITTEMADETLARADQIYKANGPVDHWPQPTSGADPFIQLYYEIFAEDGKQALGYFMNFISDDFYNSEMASSDTEYSVGTYLRSHHVNSMGDVYRDFDDTLLWSGGPLHSGEFDENYAYQVADELEEIVGEPVSVEGGDSYGDINTAHSWVVTSDASIRPDEDKGDDAGLEIITPAMEYLEGIGHIISVFDYLKSKDAYVNSSTGLHINVSLDNIAHSMLNYPKLVVMLGDEAIMDQYHRTFNEYAMSSLDSLSNMMNANVGFPRDKPRKVKEIAAMMGKLRGDFNNAVASSFENVDFGKFSSVGIREGWIEFRAAGGENYLDDLDDIISMINRFIMAYIVACDPEAYKNEYGKKLYRLISDVTGKQASPNAMALFAKFSAGIITKDELISRVSAIRAEKGSEIAKSLSARDALDAIAEISKKGRVTLAYAQVAWNAGMDVEMKRFSDSSNATLQKKRATKEVYANLMKDVKHYRKAGMPPTQTDVINNIADEHDIEDVEAKEFLHAAMGHELRLVDDQVVAAKRAYKNLMNDLRHYNR